MNTLYILFSIKLYTICENEIDLPRPNTDRQRQRKSDILIFYWGYNDRYTGASLTGIKTMYRVSIIYELSSYCS